MQLQRPARLFFACLFAICATSWRAPAQATAAGIAPRTVKAWVRDTSFGVNGVVRIPGVTITELDQPPNGPLLATGFQTVSTQMRLDFVTAISTSGQIAAGFGDSGRRDVVHATFDTLPTQVIVRPDGEFTTISPLSSGYVLRRFTPAGQPAPGFGSGGPVTVSLPALPGLVGITALHHSSGALFVFGLSQSRYWASRHLPNGTMDVGYGTNGVREGLDCMGQLARVELTSGKMQLHCGFELLRLTAEGLTDTFGPNGNGYVRVSPLTCYQVCQLISLLRPMDLFTCYYGILYAASCVSRRQPMLIWCDSVLTA